MKQPNKLASLAAAGLAAGAMAAGSAPEALAQGPVPDHNITATTPGAPAAPGDHITVTTPGAPSENPRPRGSGVSASAINVEGPVVSDKLEFGATKLERSSFARMLAKQITEQRGMLKRGQIVQVVASPEVFMPASQIGTPEAVAQEQTFMPEATATLNAVKRYVRAMNKKNKTNIQFISPMGAGDTLSEDRDARDLVGITVETELGAMLKRQPTKTEVDRRTKRIFAAYDQGIAADGTDVLATKFPDYVVGLRGGIATTPEGPMEVPGLEDSESGVNVHAQIVTPGKNK